MRFEMARLLKTPTRERYYGFEVVIVGDLRVIATRHTQYNKRHCFDLRVGSFHYTDVASLVSRRGGGGEDMEEERGGKRREK